MAHIRCDVHSNCLEMNTSMTVILPENIPVSEASVIFLLHGLEDNSSGWSRYTSVERYAREHDLVLVIPEVQRSFYTNMESGLRYFDYVHDEIPEICHRLFNISLKGEKTYLMGLSMGGYGVLKCLFSTPDRYAGAAVFSAVTDIKKEVENAGMSQRREFNAIFGDSIPVESDVYALLEDLSPSDIPHLYLACGDRDSRLFHSEKLYETMKEKNMNVKFETWSGDHNWIFWDEAVKKAIDLYFGKEV